ncbi:glucosyl transferase family 2 [Aerococcus urinaehominis]|uniref:Glucosyl transferase family 2 n=1 Tax=Aerococcus urinaehominis TaxID=128944 RepID=A0A120IAN1_9LACT|nr:glycosyltransferase family 2 protein [Aerococcus urinaehominis]AMB98575.1 glucosyl transferase family 2 [Aerococcus urinaehominis]SDL77391.1 Glycosyltransferase involved in cell wall bisynthesis [Aerococcus urinaehominis]
MISIIVPCYNEEAAIPLFYQAMEAVKPACQHQFEYIFVNDGSSDQSLTQMRQLAKLDPQVRYISFSRNFGKEAGIYAGLQAARGDLVTLMDVDLQDPPELLPEMIACLKQDPELDCVGTRRTTRTGEPPIRSLFAKAFYWGINKISDTHFVDGVRDYRLMTRQMVDAVLEMTEYNRFSKGIFAWVGFKTKYLSFENRDRVAGETSWSFWSLFSYSIEAIINFSDFPLTLAAIIGALMFLFSLLAGLFIIIRTLIFADPVQGWPSMMTVILFIGGIQLLCLGIIGKYIGKIFLETKHRPIYIVKETEADILVTSFKEED